MSAITADSAAKRAASSAPKNRSLTWRTSGASAATQSWPAGVRLSSTLRPSSGLGRLRSRSRRASLRVSAVTKALLTCSRSATWPTETPRPACRWATAIRMLYCGPVRPARPPRWLRTASSWVATVRKSASSWRNRRSEPRVSSGGCDTVSGAVNPDSPPRAGLARSGLDIFGVGDQHRLDRDFERVVHRVVELPEADHAGQLDDLRRAQMLDQPLVDLVGHVGRVLGGGAHEIEADALELVLGLV